jgi:hypothetical protein
MRYRNPLVIFGEAISIVTIMLLIGIASFVRIARID